MNTTRKAIWIDEIEFAYKCNSCGGEHYHGSDGYKHNRIENRGTHCTNENGNVNIEINDNTERRTNNMNSYVNAINYSFG
jgi:hypothetical protein